MMKKVYYSIILIFSTMLYACGGDGGVDTPPDLPPVPNPSVEIPNTEVPQLQGATYWWNEAVFYEIFVRSFYDTDGDGIGDIKGIVEKLDYIQNDLGATAIWLMPINPSPSYHGYDVTNYRAINPDYGTMQDFQKLVQELHKRGMKIIIDYVINHTSDKHPWFQSAWSDKNSSYRAWYVFEETKPSWGNWHGNDDNGYYYGIFSYAMPDLNYNNRAVKDEIKATAEYWLKEIGVDGFRLDAVKFIKEEGTQVENTSGTLAYWDEFGKNVKSAKSDALTVAEAWDNSHTIANYVNTNLDLAFEFEVSNAIMESIKKGNPGLLKAKMTELRTLYPYHQYATFISNHDNDRSYETMGKSIPNSKLAASLLLTLPGTPFIYYGEEIGMWGKKGGDEWVRTPLHWTNNAATAGFTTGKPWWQIIGDQETKNIATQKGDKNSLLSTYRKLSVLRKQYPQLTKGTFQTLGVNTSSVYGYLREAEGKAIVIVHNFAGNTIKTPKIYAKSANLEKGTYKVTDLLSGKILEDVELNTDGGFLFQPLTELRSKESKMLLMEKR